MTFPDTERRATTRCESSCDSQLELPTYCDVGQHRRGSCVSFLLQNGLPQTYLLKTTQVHYLMVPMGQESGHKIAGPSAQGLTRLQLSVGCTAILICSPGASSRLILIPGRMQSLAILGLRFLLSCLLSTGGCSQLL